VNNGRGLAAFREEVASGDFKSRSETRHLLAAMVLDGVFARHPGLKVLIAESGCAWLPQFLHELDRRTRNIGMDGAYLENFYKLPLRPSEYIRRQVKFSPLIGQLETSFEHLSLRDLFDQLPDPEMLLFSSDYPHVEGRVDAASLYEKHLPDDPELRDQFYGGAAASFLGV
jgi:predicted TIM-barrel fold metal-dependent hydrolase